MTPDKAAQKVKDDLMEQSGLVKGGGPLGRKSALQRAGPYEVPPSKASRVEGAEGMAIDVEGLPAVPVLPGAQNYASTPITFFPMSAYQELHA